VTRTPKHCLGVYADVLRPGEVRVGDPVLVGDPAGTRPAEPGS
jgi:MOSC domain-containing protein YiiM